MTNGPASNVPPATDNSIVDINGGNIDGATIGSNNPSSGKFTTMDVTGDFTVYGTTTTIDTTTLVIEDPLIQLAKNNTQDAIDIGIYGQYTDGVGLKYSGIYRDAVHNSSNVGKWRLFTNLTQAPGSTTIGEVGANGYQSGTLVSNIEGDIYGNASTATIASTITIANESGSDTSCSVLFTTNSSGNLAPKTSAHLSFNASTSELLVGGDITAYSSDKRLKRNIEVIESPLEKINKLSGFTYYWSKEKCETAGFKPNDEKQIGVFAQDVQEVIPEAVKIAPFDRDNNGKSKSGDNYLTVQYEKIVPLLIESIKEQQKQIEELRNIIYSLKLI